MQVKDLIKMMLEMDDQIVCPRPSSFLRAARLIHKLAEAAEPVIRDLEVFGDGWEEINISSNRKCGDRRGW